MGRVVDDHVVEVGEPGGADGRQGSELHENGAVAVEHQDLALSCPGHAKTEPGGTTHGSDHVEPVEACVLAVVELIEFTRQFSGGGDHGRATLGLIEQRQNHPQRLLSGKLGRVALRRGRREAAGDDFEPDGRCLRPAGQRTLAAHPRRRYTTAKHVVELRRQGLRP